MPTYEYICEECGNRFEKLRSMKDADLDISCNKCNSTNTHRGITSCYSKSNGIGSSTSSSNGGGCSGCSGGSCTSCRH